jgi:NAD+ kinase
MQFLADIHSQVVFEGDFVRRRKASLAPPPGSKVGRPENGRRTTSCIVHSLLQKHDGVKMEEHYASYEGLDQERRVDKDPHAHAEQTQHSRLLTKKQISDMAFGIRELSKKLAQIRLKLHVKNIFILGKAHDETLIKHSREITDWLLKVDAGYKVYVQLPHVTDTRKLTKYSYVEHTLEDNKTFDAPGLLEKNTSFKGRLKYWTNELCAQKPQTFDIVLAVRWSLPFLNFANTHVAWW